MNLFRIQENTEKNKYSLDTLKLILSVMVVFIHSRIFLDSSLILDAFTSNGFFRVAVPIFFIINGYYLPSDKNNFKKWFFSSLYLYIGLTFFIFIFGLIVVH
ncbi:TPA: acyltransferase family protein [Klebsiella pneumoniae]|uniref:acyltransferase family protein n=1 Tax=Klebsiella pneumoniae TaxID=573 RepID=UPI001438387C|nr:acyltransferase family protein [Klebsiella pneumoniae]